MAKQIKVKTFTQLKAVYRAKVTEESFRKWLRKCKDEVIGVSGDSSVCPIAKFAIFTGFALGEDGIGAATHVIKGFRGVEIASESRTEISLPARRWAQRFVSIVDERIGDVTGKMGLKALELAVSTKQLRDAEQEYTSWVNAQRDLEAA